jgi:hypothetical protein
MGSIGNPSNDPLSKIRALLGHYEMIISLNMQVMKFFSAKLETAIRTEAYFRHHINLVLTNDPYSCITEEHSQS